MRDKARIPLVLDLIKKIWEKSPDQRFLQLVYNLQREYSNKNDGAGEIVDGMRTGYDLFHIEDGEFIKFLESR